MEYACHEHCTQLHAYRNKLRIDHNLFTMTFVSVLFDRSQTMFSQQMRKLVDTFFTRVHITYIRLRLLSTLPLELKSSGSI